MQSVEWCYEFSVFTRVMFTGENKPDDDGGGDYSEDSVVHSRKCFRSTRRNPSVWPSRKSWMLFPR